MMKIFLTTILLCLISCTEVQNSSSALVSDPSILLRNGDIIVTSITADDAVAYRSDGSSRQITSIDRTAERVYGTQWVPSLGELYACVDGRDRIISINGISGLITEVIVNTQLNGNLRGLTVLEDGSIVVIESNALEKFLPNGARDTAGNFPLTINTPYAIKTLSTGNFLICAGGTTDEVRIYQPDGTLVGSTSGPGGHDSFGCAEMSDGSIVAVWNGASDQVIKYDSDLTNPIQIQNSTDIGGLFSNPRGLDVDKDDNIYIIDYTLNHILKLNSSGAFIKNFGVLHDPTSIHVIKD